MARQSYLWVTCMNGTNYERLMERSALMWRKAEETDDTYLKVFYYNASKGYALKARSIIIGTAAADCGVAWHRG